MTVSDYIPDLLQRDLALPSQRQWLARVQSRQPVDVPVVPLMDAVRAERETDVNRTGS